MAIMAALGALGGLGGATGAVGGPAGLSIGKILGGGFKAGATKGPGFLSKAGDMAGKLAMPGLAIGQGINAAIKRKQADALLPASESVLDRQTLNLIRRQIQATKNSALGNRGALARQMAKSMGTNMFKAGGPINYGMINNAMSQMASNLAQTQGTELANYMTMLQKQTTDMSDLSNELAMLRSNRKSARAEAIAKSFGMNTGALAGKDLPIGED
jgi:hypothetical protein